MNNEVKFLQSENEIKQEEDNPRALGMKLYTSKDVGKELENSINCEKVSWKRKKSVTSLALAIVHTMKHLEKVIENRCI